MYSAYEMPVNRNINGAFRVSYLPLAASGWSGTEVSPSLLHLCVSVLVLNQL